MTIWEVEHRGIPGGQHVALRLCNPTILIRIGAVNFQAQMPVPS